VPGRGTAYASMARRAIVAHTPTVCMCVCVCARTVAARTTHNTPVVSDAVWRVSLLQRGAMCCSISPTPRAAITLWLTRTDARARAEHGADAAGRDMSGRGAHTYAQVCTVAEEQAVPPPQQSHSHTHPTTRRAAGANPREKEREREGEGAGRRWPAARALRAPRPRSRPAQTCFRRCR
jgi:hypothetical protein